MNPIKAAEYVAKYKLSTVCITCTKFWKAREQNVPEPQCLANNGCASPIAGRSFHEYEGPITDFTRWCFVCGVQPSKLIQVTGSARIFGICDEHFSYMQQMQPVAMPELPKTNKRLIIQGGDNIDIDKKDPYKKQTLGEFIDEVEGYYQKKEENK